MKLSSFWDLKSIKMYAKPNSTTAKVTNFFNPNLSQINQPID